MARIQPFEQKLTQDATVDSVGLGNGIGAWNLLPSFQQDEYFNQMVYEFVSSGGPIGRVEVTNAPIEDVKLEIATPGSQANVIGFPWSPGDVSEPTVAVSPPPTAWRLVSTSGIIVVNGRATA